MNKFNLKAMDKKNNEIYENMSDDDFRKFNTDYNIKELKRKDTFDKEEIGMKWRYQDPLRNWKYWRKTKYKK